MTFEVIKSEYWKPVNEVLAAGFAITSIVLVILSLFRAYPKQVEKIATINNSVSLVCSLFFIINAVTIVYEAYHFAGSEKDNFAFYSRVLGKYFFFYIMQVALPVILPQLVWFKKLRSSVWLGLAIAFFMYLFFILQNVMFLLINMNDEFTPMDWSFLTYYNWQWLASSVFVYGVFLAAVYYATSIFFKRNPLARA